MYSSYNFLLHIHIQNVGAFCLLFMLQIHLMGGIKLVLYMLIDSIAFYQTWIFSECFPIESQLDAQEEESRLI